MAKLRKTFGDVTAPSTVTLMRLIETQNKTTVANWTLDYAERTVLPLFKKYCPNDERPAHAIAAADRSDMMGIPATKRCYPQVRISATEENFRRNWTKHLDK